MAAALPPWLLPRRASRRLPRLLALSLLLCAGLLVALHPTSASTPPLSLRCDSTFLDFDPSTDYPAIDLLALTSMAAQCPANCTQHLLGLKAGSSISALPPVYGSFPYHGRSSLYLAAVHAGLVSAEKGGGVFVSRYHPFDWSGSSTQTIFPHTFAQGTTSNAVTSVAVEAGWYRVPSNRSSEWSYVLRGRGDFVAQRQRAPATCTGS